MRLHHWQQRGCVYNDCLAGHGEQAEGEGEGCRQEQGEGEAAPHREHQVNQKTTQGLNIWNCL